MPLPQEFSDFFEWPFVQKATSASEVRDWFDQWKVFENTIDADVKRNRIKQVFKSDTSPVTLTDKNSNSVIHNGSLPSQTYNLPLIVAGTSIGMYFLIISDSVSNTVSLQASGSDLFYVSGASVGSVYNVTDTSVIVTSTDVGVWSVSPELPVHSASHENGGIDEINVAGLSGLLADPQTPLPHSTTHRQGSADEYLDVTTTVSASTYTVLSTDRILFVDYTDTAPVLITIPDALRTKTGFRLNIIDTGNATINNITFEDASNNIIARIQSTGSSMDFVSDGTNMRL